MSQKGWDVVQRGRVVNRVFFDSDMSADEVRRSLVEHDGFPADIRVVAESTAPRGASGGSRMNPNVRSKLVNLGFVVADTRTGKYLSELFTRREPARDAVRTILLERPDATIGVHTMQAHVPADWKRGDSLEGYAEPRDLAHLGIAVTLTPNEDLTWREVYARAYQAAEAQGLEEWRARQEASRAAWADYEARTGPLGQAANDSLHRRIAEALGWSESGTRSMSLASLRDLVRPVDPALAEEIGNRIRSGSHIARPGGAQRSQAELWRQMFGREPPSQRPNASGYYVWALASGSNEPLAEGPWGPYETLESAKTFARIGATEGAHDRAVSLGFDPESASFRLVRRYEARTGERLL